MGASGPALALVPPLARTAEASLPPELARYAEEPRQMRSGAVGKSGRLRLGFEVRDGITILGDLEAQSPFLAQRALHLDEALPEMAWLFMITTTGCVLQGDRFALDVSLGPQARAHLTTQSATKVHAMDANCAMQTQQITLEDGAYLEFLPEPLIPHRGSRFGSDTRVTIAETASLLVSEIVQPGRRHHHPDECFGLTVLSLASSAMRPDGRLLFSERLVVEPARQAMRQAGVMDAFDVFGNVFVLTPPGPAGRIHDRAGAAVDFEAGIAWGACLLPNEAGVVYKVLGRETEQVRRKLRELWQVAREEIAGAALPERFFWR